jgi:anti-repressor protein
MAHVSIDLYHAILEYGDTIIDVLFDSDLTPWYPVMKIAKLLQYQNMKQAIIDHVPSHNIKPYSELKQYYHDENIKDHTDFMNESGLCFLVCANKLDASKAFRSWIYDEVLPSMRKFGYYRIKQKSKKKSKEKLDAAVNELKQEYHNKIKVSRETLKIVQKLTKMKNAVIGGLDFDLELDVD